MMLGWSSSDFVGNGGWEILGLHYDTLGLWFCYAYFVFYTLLY